MSLVVKHSHYLHKFQTRVKPCLQTHGSFTRTYLLSLESCRGIKLGFDLIQDLLELGSVVLVFGQEDIGPPVGRVEAPVAGPVLEGLVRMTHELVRGEHSVAVHTFYALGHFTGVQFRIEDALTLAEALVVDPEAVSSRGFRCFFRIAVEQGVTQALRVSLRDKSAALGELRKDLVPFKDAQLIWIAAGAVDLEFVADVVDLPQVKVPQHRVQDLWQTKSLFPSHYKTCYLLTFQDCGGFL